MIFNSEYTSYDNMVVTESPYPLGLEGALMHVYENECNFNAMMKAVGISELRYYQETGGDLFVQEAGAFGGFIAKAKAFFKKVIEKIKQIFHKFVAVINQYTMNDKKFVKTYSKELMRRNYTDFEVEGYTFDGLDAIADGVKEDMYGEECDALEAGAGPDDTITEKDVEKLKEGIKKAFKIIADEFSDPDKLNDIKEAQRGGLYAAVCKGSPSGMDESDFREEVKNYMYGNDGDKDTIEVDLTKIRAWLGAIETASKDISNVNKVEKKITRTFNRVIKALDRWEGKLAKYKKDDTKDTANDKNDAIKIINGTINILQSSSNDITVLCGILVQALKDRNRQSKAFCVKALSYKNKNESATYTESYYDNDDIFANVVIR